MCTRSTLIICAEYKQNQSGDVSICILKPPVQKCPILFTLIDIFASKDAHIHTYFKQHINRQYSSVLLTILLLWLLPSFLPLFFHTAYNLLNVLATIPLLSPLTAISSTHTHRKILTRSISRFIDHSTDAPFLGNAALK